jgi:hypothetical protein
MLSEANMRFSHALGFVFTCLKCACFMLTYVFGPEMPPFMLTCVVTGGKTHAN